MSEHDLSVAYALDALEPDEARAYERHLRTCAQCRAEVAELQEGASALALAVDPVAPPEALRGRILAAAGAGGEVRPFRPRVWQAATAVAAVAAVVLAAFTVSLSRKLDDERNARSDERVALTLAGNPSATRLVLTRGAVYVLPSGRAALVTDLPSPPEGKTYQAWVYRDGVPVSAGTFTGRAAVLSANATQDSRIAVTVEDAGGAERPTGPVVTEASAA